MSVLVGYLQILRACCGGKLLRVVDKVGRKSLRDQIKYEHVSILHCYKSVPVIFRLCREGLRYVETANLARFGVWMGNSDLNLTVRKISHVPQLEHIGDVNRNEETFVWRKGDPRYFKIVRIVNFQLVPFEGEYFDYARACAHC